MLQLNSFGKSPAAEHLVRQLNALTVGKSEASRSVSKSIRLFNENIKCILEAVDHEAMTAKVAANLLRLLRSEAQTVNIQAWDDAGVCTREHITNLTRNVVIGNIKQAIRKITVIRQVQNNSSTFAKAKRSGQVSDCLGRKCSVEVMGHPAGYLTHQGVWVQWTPFTWTIEDEVTAEILHERSDRRQARKEKL